MPVAGFKPSQLPELRLLYRVLEEHVTDFRLAIDGGAHVGGWTDVLAEHFETVIAYEPASDTFERLRENMAGRQNVRLVNAALMDRRQPATMVRNKGNASRQFSPMEGGDVQAVALDDTPLLACGLLKLDLEGCEILALRGARLTIKTHRPFIIVEEYGHGARLGFGPEAVAQFLGKLRYREVIRDNVNVGYAPT